MLNLFIHNISETNIVLLTLLQVSDSISYDSSKILHAKH